MTISEAKELLAVYRPGVDEVDRSTQDALDLAKTDASLGEWWRQEQAGRVAMRQKLSSIAVPAGLRERLLQERKIVRPNLWQQTPAWLAAAAAIALLAAAWWMVNLNTGVPDRFANYRQRMVSTALRQYRMDIVTKDMAQVRGFLSSGGAPADYALPRGLQRLELTGAGLLRWRNHPVGMVCFNRGDNQMLYLFVMEREAVKDPPPSNPQPVLLHNLATVSWTSGDKVYVLAGPNEEDFVNRYL